MSRLAPADYDLQVHTARKFAHLATCGNPSILMILFGPVTFSTPLGDAARALAPAFWSIKARSAFLGYAQAQRERLAGERGGRHVNRRDLEAAHGYDTKYAMHMLRLGFQGIEYMTTGRLVLPMEDARGDFLRSVRRGEQSLDDVLAMAEGNETVLRGTDWAARGVPATPDISAVNDWLLDVHRTMLP